MTGRGARRPGAATPALLLLVAVAGVGGAPGSAHAQAADAATIAELRQQLQEMRRRDEEMRRRMEQLEALVARQARPQPAPTRAARAPAAPPAATQADVQAAQAAAREARAAADQAQGIQQSLARTALPPAGGTAPAERDVPGLQPPEPMGDQTATGDALRSDLPGIAFRVPAPRRRCASMASPSSRPGRMRMAATRPMRHCPAASR
jgi:hypothetical protein